MRTSNDTRARLEVMGLHGVSLDVYHGPSSVVCQRDVTTSRAGSSDTDVLQTTALGRNWTLSKGKTEAPGAAGEPWAFCSDFWGFGHGLIAVPQDLGHASR